jgi:hypothetical protein
VTIEALAAILGSGGEADDVLRDTVSYLSTAPGATWAGIAFQEAGELALGPQAGHPDEARRTRVQIAYGGDRVGELWVDGDVDRALLDAAAEMVSPYVLIGWDTGGEAWEP